jgi:lipopolysaccharide export system permease protein
MNRRGLKVGGRLDRYVGSLYLASYATAFLMVVGLFLILDLASKLDGFLDPWPDGSQVPTLTIVRYYVLNIPFLFLQVAPFVALVAGLFSVAKLMKHSEIVAALGAGVSSHRILAPIFLGGILSALGMFALREVACATLANLRDDYRFVLEKKRYDRVYEDLHVRDLSGSVVLLQEFRPIMDGAGGSMQRSAGRTAVGAEVRGLEAYKRYSLARWVETKAERAEYGERDGKIGWWLEGGLKTETVQGIQKSEPVEFLEGFDFTPEMALSYHRADENPLELSFAEARELSRRDPDNVVYQTLLQYHLTFPLASIVLLLVGLPILLRHEKRGAEGLAKGSLLCIFYFAADFIFRNMGLQGGMDPMLAAWMPVLAFGSLGLVLFDGMKT